MTKVIRFALPAIAATSTRKMTDEGKLFVDEDDALQSGERRQPARKGTFQKRFSGIRPLRGGGYPPFPLRKKTFFFSH